MATGLENLWIYRLAEDLETEVHEITKKFPNIARGETEETKRNIGRSFRKGFILKEKSDDLINRYTILLKGIHAYIKFLMLNELKTK